MTRTTYLKRFRQVIRLYLAYLDDPSGFWMSRGRRGPTRASTSPSQDGTAASLVGFCRWLAEQGMVSVGRADQLCQAVRRVLAPDPDWERSDVRRLDVDGLLQRLATATTPPLRLSTLRFYSSSFRKAVRLYLAYLDDPADFHASGTVLTRWRTRTVAAQASVPAAHQPAAAPMPTVVYPFPLRGSHTIWLRLPADLTRVEAHRLAMFIQALAIDAQPPPDPATAPGGWDGEPPSSRAGGRMPHLSPAAQAILATLAEHPSSTVAELAERVGVHRITPHGILPKLERHGLVIRHRGRRGPGGGPDRW